MKQILNTACAVLFSFAALLLTSCGLEDRKPNAPVLNEDMVVTVSGNTVNLSYDNDQKVDELTWKIKQGDNVVFTSNDRTVTTTINTPGEYDVTLSLVNAAGKVFTKTRITIAGETGGNGDTGDNGGGDNGGENAALDIKTAVTFFADGFANQYISDGTAEGDCKVTGDGKYKISFAAPAPAGDVMVLVVDLLESVDKLAKDTKITVTRITVDGKAVAFDPSKVLTGTTLGGDQQPKNSLRIEIFDALGNGTKNDPPMDPAALAGQTFEIYFIVEGSGVAAPDAPKTKSLITFFNAGWMPAYDGSGAGECEIKGDGAYTASFEIEGATEAFVLTLDILDAQKIYNKDMKVTIDRILLDGETEVAFDESKMNKGFGLNPMNPEDQSYRVSIYDAAGGEVPDPAINPADFAFSKCEITFFVEGTGF